MSAKKESKLIKYLGSYRGKTLFNFFYGFGAAVAILGTLFKILHLDGANVMLALGLGTEVLMFAISAFEPPFRNYHWEEVFPILKSGNAEDRPNFNGGMGGGVVIGNAPVVAQTTPAAPTNQPTPTTQPMPTASAAEAGQQQTVVTQVIGGGSASFGFPSQVNLSEEESRTLETSMKEYVEQMDTLNLNLRGLNTIYEIQLKSISSQIDTIDRINQGLVHIKDMYEGSATDSESFVTETEQMANNLASLNQIYTRMLQAMVSGSGFMGHSFNNPDDMPAEETTAGSKKAKPSKEEEA